MTDTLPPLPPGFQIDAAPAAAPPLPIGFQREAAAPVAAPASAAAARDAGTVQAEYDAMPWYAQAGQAADDIVRLIANGVTFGYADKLAGAMGDGTEVERARTQEARDRAGWAGTAAEIGGSAAVPIAAGGAGLTLAGRLGTNAMTGLGGLAARSGLMAAEGAGYGALTAAGNDQDIGDGALLGAIFGAGGNAAAEGLTSAVGALASNVGRPAVPTMDALTSARDAAYQAADNAGIVYTPDAVNRIRTRVVQELADMGYDPALQPGAKAVLDRIDGLVGQNVSLKGLDTVRKVANNGYIPGNKANDKAIGILVNAIDDVVENPTTADVLIGNAQAGADALNEARELARRAFKANEVDNAVVRAERRAASTGKGGNVDNATRQNVRQILDRGARGYTPDEVAALEQVVYGTPTQNFMRWAGGFAPQNIVGGGMGAMVGGGAASALGLPPMVGAGTMMGLGQAAKVTADSMTRGNVDDLIEIIMSGRAPQPNAVQRGAAAVRDDLARMIMQGGNVEANR